MDEMRLYLCQHDGDHFYVEAPTMYDAIRIFVAWLTVQNPPDLEDGETPYTDLDVESCALVCERAVIRDVD